MEPTYVERESIRQFTCKYERHNGPLSTNSDDPTYAFLADEFNNPEIPVVTKEKSVASACQLLKDLKSMDIHDGIQHGVNAGVIVGSLKRRDLSANQQQELRKLARYINGEERIEINVRENLYFLHFLTKYTSTLLQGNATPSLAEVRILHVHDETPVSLPHDIYAMHLLHSANIIKFIQIIKWNCNEELEEFSVGDQCIVSNRENEGEEWMLTITAFIYLALLLDSTT